MPKLAPKQQLFVQEYLKDLNATRAAIAAGYSKRSARQVAHRMLTNDDIQAAVASAKAARSERVQLDADMVLVELDAVARSNIADVLRIEVFDDGTFLISPKDLSKLPERVQRGIKSIEQTVTERLSPDGGEPLKTVKLKIEMHSKTAGLRMVMDHLGMDAPKKLEHTGKDGKPIQLQATQARSTTELKARALELASKK